MSRVSSHLSILVLAIGSSLVWIGCGPGSPQEKVAQTRSFYSARLNGFIIEEEPLEVETLVAEDDSEEAEGEVDEAVSESVDEIETEELAPVPVRQMVRLDVLIQHRSPERLAGITVDISMADSAGEEKQHWRVWFDTSEIEKATVTQFTHILEDVGYEEGDGFFVEVRHPVPPEERGEYQEFPET